MNLHGCAPASRAPFPQIPAFEARCIRPASFPPSPYQWYVSVGRLAGGGASTSRCTASAERNPGGRPHCAPGFPTAGVPQQREARTAAPPSCGDSAGPRSDRRLFPGASTIGRVPERRSPVRRRTGPRSVRGSECAVVHRDHRFCLEEAHALAACRKSIVNTDPIGSSATSIGYSSPMSAMPAKIPCRRSGRRSGPTGFSARSRPERRACTNGELPSS